MYQECKKADDIASCQLVGNIFKRLLAIVPMPDIILVMLNNNHYKDFFSCMSLLEENRSLKLNMEQFFAEQAHFNNIFQIDN